MNSQISCRIRTLRETQNYTQHAFAEKVGISTKFLYEIESHHKGFSADTLAKISKALSVSCDFLMTGVELPGRNNEKIMGILRQLEPEQIALMVELLETLLYVRTYIQEDPATQ